MPFITQDEIDSRINSEDNLVNKLKRTEIVRGRGLVSDTPIEIQKTLAILRESGESARDLGEAFGLDKTTVNNYGLARNTSRNQKDSIPELKETLDKVKGIKASAELRAIELMAEALEIVPEKMDKIKTAGGAANVALKLASIAEKMSGKREEDRGQQVHLHIFVPKMKEMDDYEVIDATN